MRTRARSGVLAAVQALLLVLTVSSAAVVVLWAFGVNGLGLVSGAALPDPPIEPNAMVSEPVLVSGRAGVQTVAAANEAVGGPPVGSVEPGSGDVEFYGNEAHVSVLNPTWTQHAAWVAVRALPALGLAVLWFLLFLTVRDARRGHAFARPVPRRLVAVGLLVLVGLPLVEAGRWLVSRWIVTSTEAAEVATVWPFDPSLWPFAVGAVVLVLAAVWREAVRMREDLEGLV